MPWAKTDRIVCADSYFTSVPDAEELWKHGLCFIGFIKIATSQFTMVYLSNIYFHNQGDMSGLLTRPIDRTKPVLGDFVWVDWNRRYFIFTGRSMYKGWTYTHMWWIQGDPSPNADPNVVELTIPQPITAEIYYITRGHIDRHNRCRQESLDIKKSWVLEICWSGSTYLFLWLMCPMPGWHTKASLERRRPNLISKIISLKRWYITPTIGSWYGVQRGGGGLLLTLMTKHLMTTTHSLAGSMVLPDM